MSHVPFHGSLRPEDGEFLLQVLPAAAMVSVAEKEALIQSGARHYGEMLSPEQLPAPDYLALFHAAMQTNAARLATDIQALAVALAARAGREVVLASLARAGTPIAAVLAHRLRALGLTVAHYSVSIIRDHGIDAAALGHIAARHSPDDVWFVDGWTAKGVITQELQASLAGTPFTPRLCAVADLAGVATLAATAEDYLIPSALFNATVSGLVSRTVLTEQGFHGCLHYAQWQAQDLTQHYIRTLAEAAVPPQNLPAPNTELFEQRREWLSRFTGHQLKPGIGEASRALLRRKPHALHLQNADDAATAHLAWLSKASQIPVFIQPQLPWAALAIL